MANSTSITSMVANFMVKYDHNKNGQIDLKRPEGFKEKLFNPDERVRSETAMHSYKDIDGRDRVTISTQAYSMHGLFYASDANRDNKVTREELEATVSKFDENGNGKLESRGFMGFIKGEAKGELEKFKNELGEKATDYDTATL